MALKSTKTKNKSNSSLVLVVSTLEMEKGQKRKAQGDTDKEKGKKKKGESSLVPALEHDSLYFIEDEAQERCNLDFSLRKMLNGRWIDYRFFDYHNFEYSSKMDNLGWTPMTTLHDDVYPELVRHFYANSTRGDDSDTIISYVKGVKLELD